MTVALFLQICQILSALGGASQAIIAIRKDVESRQLQPSDPLPPEHEAAVRAALPLTRDSTAQDFIDKTLRG